MGAEDLLRRLANGESGAIEELVRDYRQALIVHIRICLRGKRVPRIPNDPQQFSTQVESVFNSTLTRFLERVRRGELGGEDAFKLLAYLKTIATHVIADRQKAGAKHSAQDGIELDNLVDTAPDPADQVADHEIKNWLDRYLDHLSIIERNVVLMRLEAIPFTEIGERVGITASSARSYYHRAVLKLRKLADPKSEL